MKRVAVILSGCGVFDGSEIQEAVLSLLCLDQKGASYNIFAPDVPQYHTLNHLTGDPDEFNRNVLEESARIARGQIKPLSEYEASEFDALVIPGGFGAAKNLSTWAFEGPQCSIEAQTQRAILATVQAQKPICAMCMAPVVVAKALQGSQYEPMLTVGSDEAESPYEIEAISQGLKAVGAKPEMKTVSEICIDSNLKIVSAPCYMMKASISEVFQNIQKAMEALFLLM
jgi:enhancing lycopene biosynthesis protein 2